MNQNRAMWQMNQERHNELLEVSHAHQVVKKPRVRKPRVKDTFFLNVGDLLVSFGLRLKARHESALQ
jgi:hypothetical protein